MTPTVQKVMAEKAFELVIAGVVALIVLLIFNHYQDLRRASAQNETRGQVLTNASAGVQDGVEVDAQQQAYEKGLSDARAMFQSTIEDAKANEPETLARSLRPVPDSVRRAYRERRIARERLGCVGRECETEQPTNTAAER